MLGSQVIQMYEDNRAPLKIEQHSKSEFSIGPEHTNDDSDVIRSIMDWCDSQNFAVRFIKRYRTTKKYMGGPGVYHTFLFKELNEAMLFKLKWL
jgi:hypothetical protein